MPHAKARVDRYSEQTLFHEKINGIFCCTETKDLSTFWSFNKQQENYKLNQYVQQNACSLLLTQAIPGDSRAAVFFLHFVFRTDTWKLED